MPKNRYLIVAAVVVIALAGLFWYRYATVGEPPSYRHSSLAVIRTDGKTFSFSVEVALSIHEQAYGLMFVKNLPADEGMIFPFTPAQNVSFWMKNTLIPLDMLFIRPNGTIGRIVSNAIPQDLTPVPSLEPVIAVIEIKGGIAKTDGFEVGDKVLSPLLSPTL